ncbi:MAG: hypothetical protein AB1567_07835, partial [bacterium]
MTDKDNRVTSYEYDAVYRLTKVVYPHGTETTYTYDPVGNRLSMNGISYSYDAADRLLQAGATSYSYDANGNMISKTENGITTNYSYDYANRLTLISHPSSLITHKYDGFGRRISREAKITGGFRIPEVEYTEYLWDGTNVLLEFPQDGRARNPVEYIYGNGQLVSRDDLLNLGDSIVHQGTQYFHSDGLESTVNLTDENGSVTMSYEYDGLGSTINLTDEKGSVTMTYAYDAFGAVTKEEDGVGWKKNDY